tara:strand:- start:4539 stop:7205 length:2667 start_codon:yes stop_codon:yes gene_type:complete
MELNNSMFVITKNSTKLFQMDNIIKEPCDVNILKKIINSGWNKTYTDQKWLEEFNVPFNDARTHLEKLIKKCKRGFLTVTATIKEYGRASFKNQVSLALLPNELRQCIAIQCNLIDYDIENAMPTILYNVVKKAGVDSTEYKHLDTYIKKRDNVLKAIANWYFHGQEYNKDLYKRVKQLIISVCFFGGGTKSWKEKNGIDKNKQDYAFVIKLKNEVSNINTNYVILNNQDIFAETKKKNMEDYQRKMKNYLKEVKKGNNPTQPYQKDPRNTLMSKFLGDWECKIIEFLLLKLQAKKIIVKGRFVYVYDGFMIQKKVELSKLSEWVKEEFGFDLKFTIKEPDEGKKILKEVDELIENDIKDKDHPEESLKKWDREYFKSIQYDYPLQKDYFEKFFCYTEKEGNYWRSNNEYHNDPITGELFIKRSCNPYTDDKLRKNFKQYRTNPEFESAFGNKVTSFVDRWTSDPEKKTFDRMDFYPQNKPFDKLKDNTEYFNSFSGYPQYVFNQKTENYQKHINLFKNLTKNILGGDENDYLSFMNIVSYKIKFPARKKPYAIIIKGSQGEGKNWLLNILGKIVGDQHYLTTSNINDIIDTHAMGLFHKLIVNLNEMDLTSTKNLQNRFKSIISESDIMFNPKNAQPFETINYALIVVTSNENLPVTIDLVSGDRRWFCYRGNKKNCTLQEQWDKVFEITNSEEFKTNVYNYIMSFDCEKFDFKKAKRQNAKGEAYNQISHYFVPNELNFIKDKIINCEFLNKPSFCDLDDEESDNEVEYIEQPYFKYDEFYKPWDIEAGDLCRDFWDWCKSNRITYGVEKSRKAVLGNFMKHNLEGISKKLDSKTRRAVFTLKPDIIIRDMVQRNLFDENVEEFKLINKEGGHDVVEKLTFDDLIN